MKTSEKTNVLARLCWRALVEIFRSGCFESDDAKSLTQIKLCVFAAVHPNIINEVLVFRSVNKVIHHPAMVTLLQLLTADLRPLICDLSSPFYRRQLVAIFPDQPW
jgi:hypothetical protein